MMAAPGTMERQVRDLEARRGLLATESNPVQRIDYVVTLEGHVAGSGDRPALCVSVRYVPDKLLLTPRGLRAYLEGLAALGWRSVEETAVTVLEDLNNELVARWVQVAVSMREPRAGLDAHRVLVEDRQPRWENPGLLSRLSRL
jgi:7-cyano-7-deazaguanine reductase